MMEEKLVGANAKVGIVIRLQRASPKYMMAKRAINTLRKELKQQKRKEFENIKEEETKALQVSLYRIREELFRTEQSGKQKVASSLVHENSQIMEDEELSNMLKTSEQEKEVIS